VRDSLLDTRTVARLDTLFGRLAGTLTAHIRDTLLNQRTRSEIDSSVAEIARIALGPGTRLSIDSMIGSAGQSVRLQAALLTTQVGSMIHEMLQHRWIGDTALMAIDSIRAHVIGAGLAMEVHTLLDTIDNHVRGNTKNVEKSGTTIIWTLAIAAALLAAFLAWLWVLKRRYKNMAEIMTHAIHYIPNQSAYDELTDRIKQQAQAQKVERHLQRVLKQQGIFRDQNWNPVHRTATNAPAAGGPLPMETREKERQPS
jgi:hypothetical protein